jgi:multicomponent Na+:H+ antiporter subunit D
MDNHLFLLLLVPLLGAVFAALLMKFQRTAHILVVLCAIINASYAAWLLVRVTETGRQVTQAASVLAPYGISLVADRLSGFIIALAAVLVLIALLLNYAEPDHKREPFLFYPLLLLVLLGINGVSIAGDLFSLYVWQEALSIAALGLLTLSHQQHKHSGGVRYLLPTLLASASFLIGCGLMYGLVGTLNMAQLGNRLELLARPSLVTVLASLFLIGCGTRAAIFPLFLWLPASTSVTSAAAMVIIGGGLTSAGMYTLYRLFSLIYQPDLLLLSPLLLQIANLTMLFGVLGALTQTNLRRMLAFLLISQLGSMLLGLGLASEAGLAAGMLSMVHSILALVLMFCIASIVETITNTRDIRKMGSLSWREPVLTMLWFLALLALLGMPPLGGFFARIALLHTAIVQQAYLTAGMMMLASLLLLLPLITIQHEVFWKRLPVDVPPPRRVTIRQITPAVLLLGIMMLLALESGPVVDYTTTAAQQAFDIDGYVRDVLRSTEELRIPGE